MTQNHLVARSAAHVKRHPAGEVLTEIDDPIAFWRDDQRLRAERFNRLHGACTLSTQRTFIRRDNVDSPPGRGIAIHRIPAGDFPPCVVGFTVVDFREQYRGVRAAP
ncbi:hypothetical protein D3C75_1014800 [compost metagenome]